jgi:hypothetical protein
MKRIPLRRADGTVRAYALVDDEDYVRLDRYRWHYSHGYAIRHSPAGDGSRRTVSMHREVLRLTSADPEVDHDNREGLDNRKANLKPCTHAENMMNTDSRRGATSVYRGVSWNSRLGKWIASFRGKHVGTFTSETDAARAAEIARMA